MRELKPITIVLVDDHELIRDSVGRLLETEPRFKLVGTAIDAENAIAMIIDRKPEIVLMDIDMPGLTCFEAAERIASWCPDTRIIFLSAHYHDHYIEEAIQVEARGYLTKTQPSREVIKAIKQVAAGRVCFSPQVRERIIADADGVRLGGGLRTLGSTLTRREIQVLRYLAQGLSKKKIATTMGVSAKTIEGHTERLMKKLKIHDRVELTRFAIREGLANA